MVLNLLTTAAMVRLGKTYGNLMVDVRATNTKLRDRAIRIVTEAAETTPERAKEALSACGWEAKLAIIMLRLNIGPDVARDRILQADGFLRRALNEE